MFDAISQGWFGSVVGLLGLAVGIVGLLLYRNTKIGPRPSCQIRSLRLLGKQEQQLPSEVEILFKSKSVPRLTLTRIYLWNAGKEMMRGNQIVADDPLRCEFTPSDEILKAHVATCTRAVNKVAVQTPEDQHHALHIDFDYLDPGDGARIDVLHTSELRYPKVLGSLRGIPKGVSRIVPSPASTFDVVFQKMFKKPRILYGVMLFVGVIGLVAAALPTSWLEAIKTALTSNSTSTTPRNPISVFRFFAFLLGATYTLLPVFAMVGKRKKYPASLDEEGKEKTSAEQQNSPDEA